MLGGSSLKFTQCHNACEDELCVDIGTNEGGVRVICVECRNDVDINPQHIPGDDDSIELDAISATLHIEYEYSKLCLINGATRRWYDPHDWLEWTFITTEPDAKYDVELVLEAGSFWRLEDFGHEVSVIIDSNEFTATLTEDSVGPRQKDRRKVTVGQITLHDVGTHSLKVVPRQIVKTKMVGLTILGAALNRIKPELAASLRFAP